MEDDWWLNPELSLARQLDLEAARRTIPKLHRHDLEARLDSALVHLTTMDHLLRQALGRVIELEAKGAAAAPAQRHLEWAAEVLAGLEADQPH